MTHEELYAGLPKEKAEQWEKEAQGKWPKQFEQSKKALLAMSKEEFHQLKTDFSQTMDRLAALRHAGSKSSAVQKEIARHYGFIQTFWGKSGDIREAYKGLGQLYVDQPSYTTVNGQPNAEFALLMSDAMHHYADKK